MEHRHSGLHYVTPAQRHSGATEGLLKMRMALYAAAKARHPARWSDATRNRALENPAWLSPEQDAEMPPGKSAV